MTPKVFISHTSEFAEYPASRTYIDATIKACNASGVQLDDMSLWSAASRSAIDKCIAAVQAADIYVGILGFRYGSVVDTDDTGRSYTEIELDTALEARKPCLVFLLDELGDMPPGKAFDPAHGARQAKLRDRVAHAGLVLATFTNPDNLYALVKQALDDEKAEPPPPDVASVYRSTAPVPDPDDAERPELRVALDAVRNAAQSTGGRAIVALRGAGGFGKTSLARSLCASGEVRELFPDGIHWIGLGFEVSESEVLEAGHRLVQEFEEDCPPFDNVLAAAAAVERALGSRRALIVLDDVWHAGDLEPFLRGGPRCVRLVTTRDEETVPSGAIEVRMDDVEGDTAIRILSAGQDADAVEWSPLARQCLHWPLLLRQVNRWLRAEVRAGRRLEDAVRDASVALTDEGPFALGRSESNQGRALDATTELSLHALARRGGGGDVDVARYEDLAVFHQDLEIPIDLLVRWWGISPFRARVFASTLADLSLAAAYHADAGTILLHQVHHAYLERRLGEDGLVARHVALLDAFRPASGRWADLEEEDGYWWGFAGRHLAAADRLDELLPALRDLRFLALQTTTVGASWVDEDFRLVAGRDDAVDLVAVTFRQSSHLLTSLPPTGIAATLAARLSPPLTLVTAGAPDQPLDPWTVTWTRPDRHLEPVWPMPDLSPPALERVLDLGSWLNASLSWPPADGDLLAIATETDAQIWSAQSGERLIVLRFGDDDDGPPAPVHRAVWNVHGELAIELAGGDDEPSRLHLMRNVPWLLRGESRPDDANVVVEHDSPSTAKWSSDGTRYSLSGDGVQVRDAHTQEVLVTYAGMNAEWSPHDLLAVCDGAGLAVYAPPAAEPLLEIRDGADGADIPKWSPDGEVLSALCADGAIRRWDARTGAARAVIDPPVGDDFTCLCVGPLGELAAGTGLGFLVVHAASDAALIAKVRVHEQGCSDVEWSPSGRYLATAGVDDYRVSVWDPAKLGVDESAGQRTSSYSVGWSPQGDRLLTTHADGVRLWDRDANVIALFPDDRDMTNGGAWSPDGTVCVIGSASGRLTLADAHGSVLDSWSASGDPAFAWSASGDLAYSVADGDARLLRVRAQDGAVAEVPARLDQLRLASWSPDGSRLAVVHGPETFGPDTPGRLSVVTVATGDQVDLRPLEREPVQLLWPGHSGPVLICDDSVTGWSPSLQEDEVDEITAERPVIRCAAWTPDGHRLVVGTIDGQLLDCTGWPGSEADSSQVSLEVGLLALSLTPEADRIAATTSLSTLSVFSLADDPMTIAVDGTTWACGWSPDGEVIAVAASSGVYLFRPTEVEAVGSGRRVDFGHDG